MLEWSKLRRKYREIFHWKQWVTTVIALWTLGVGVALAAYVPQVPPQTFYFAYLLLTAAFVWSLGAFLTSNFLKAKMENRVRAKKNKRRTTPISTMKRFYIWLTVGTLPIVVLFVAAIWITRSTQTARELSEMGGILTPANDADLPLPAGCTAPPNSLLVFFGNSVAFTPNEKMSIITVSETLFGQTASREILGIERNSDRSILVNAHVKTSDKKVVVDISRNIFSINQNNILSYPFPRPDKHTINLKDQYGHVLTIRYLNPHAISVLGRFYINHVQFLELTSSEARQGPSNVHLGRTCANAIRSIFNFNATSIDEWE